MPDAPGVKDPFSGLHESILEEMGPKKILPQRLYHYTSSAGLLGILSNNCVWFSDNAFLNDASEVRHGLSVLDLALKEYLEDRSDEYKDIAQSVLSDLFGHLEHFRQVIFCLCERDNLLNQWRDYGRDVTPYSIEFDSSALLVKNKFSFTMTVFPMIYDMKLQVMMAIKLIDKLFVRYHLLIKEKRDVQLTDQVLRTYAASQIAWLLYRFKNEAFAAEEEWRFAGFTPLIPKDIETKFRVTSLGVIPYYEWSPLEKGAKLPITHVTVGPSPYAQASDIALKLFLEKKGYDVATHFSTIPIRR